MSHRTKYELSLCDQTKDVWVLGEGALEIDGERWEVQALGSDEYRLRREGSSYCQRVWVRFDGEQAQVCSQGRSHSVGVESARDLALARAQGGGAKGGTGTLKSPMPGRVVSLLATIGQEVQAGEPLLIVEAMKMENELTAPVGGVVESIEVEVDQAVDAGQLLCVVRPAEAG